MSAASSPRLLRKVQASARRAAVRPRGAHLRVRLGDLRLALPDWRIYWRAPPLDRRKPPELQGLRKLRDRDSNPNLPDQNRASLPIGLSRTARRRKMIAKPYAAAWPSDDS